MILTLSLLIFTVSIVLHMIVIRYAPRIGLIDIPNERSMHKKHTPRGAGIAVFLAVISVLTVYNWDHVVTYKLVYAAISIVFLIGLIDDLYNVSPRLKFIFIFLGSLLLYFQGIHIDMIGSYFGYDVIIPALLIFPFTFFAIAGFTNALNLIDGLDGLAGTVALVILTTFFSIGMIHSDMLILTLSSSFIAALAAFWIFNWHPAKIFMGDSGSLTLGFVISILSILSLKYVTPSSMIFIAAIPLLDTFIVITRRLQRGQSPFKADKNHIHHFLIGVKGDVRFTVILLVSIQTALSIIGFQLREADDFLSLILFGLLFFIFLNLFDQRLKHRRETKKNKLKKLALKKLQSEKRKQRIQTLNSPTILNSAEQQ